jgi:hypothetical protein
MKYTNSLIYGWWLDYNIFSHNKFIKGITRICLPLILVLYAGMCCSLVPPAIIYDFIWINRVKQLKNNKRTKQYVLQRYYYEKI